MNTANLQMEGVLLAVAALCAELRRRAVLTDEDLERAFTVAEGGASARAAALRNANAEAILFPIRFLRLGLRDSARGLDYGAIAAEVGRERDRLPR
ncbi:hypothetical protein GXW78_18985 [Roseomonas terrae]|uniref:Uncharacterized protein n=1 Tax=Neoroseomonas terrae TaxID=424799 RepID=A0ABS5EMB0_9PROT|nr:hypothetical protein [Neoroseomonas terrae]MBR0651762.1 hypothetical protein [Neoroseomonas terrae]